MVAKPIKIATARTDVAADVRVNGHHVRGLMRDASAAGARLIHFPEGALSGYPKSQIESWNGIDWAALREELEHTAALAGEIGLWTVLGSNHPLTDPNRPHNSLYVISDAGVLNGRYDKRLCSNTEITDWYTPGFEPLVFEVDGLCFGCAICIEVRYPEIFDEYRRLDVDCVLLSVYNDDPILVTTAQAHASNNNFWISFAAPATTKRPIGSHLVGPDGTIVSSTDCGEPSIAIGAIDPGDPAWEIPLRKARPWRRLVRDGAIYRVRRVNDPRSEEKLGF